MFLDRLQRLRHRVRPQPGLPAADPGQVSGAIEEISPDHVAGWAMDRRDEALRVAVQAICTRTGRVLATGMADQYRFHLNTRSIGDGAHGFHLRLPAGIAAPGGVTVRAQGCATDLAFTDPLRTRFEPILHVAMDIVDNCNLRCPFCLYDYAQTRVTHCMTPQTLSLALPLLPFVRDGQFWFSCLHEPTLHPDLIAFIECVPAHFRRKLFYTTNLAKRMPDSYFTWLAQSGLHNINISIESMDPAIYERMRKGARHRIFMENWDKLLVAFAAAPAPPLIRYIAMAYKSNLTELPGMTAMLLEDRQGWQVELRYTFDLPYIPADFRAAEFLDSEDWSWLRDRLPRTEGNRVLLIEPPAAPPASGPVAAIISPGIPSCIPPGVPPASDNCLPDYYMFRLSWDGTLRVGGVAASSRGSHAIEQDMLVTTLAEMGDARAFIDRLAFPA